MIYKEGDKILVRGISGNHHAKIISIHCGSNSFSSVDVLGDTHFLIEVNSGMRFLIGKGAIISHTFQPTKDNIKKHEL